MIYRATSSKQCSPSGATAQTAYTEHRPARSSPQNRRRRPSGPFPVPFRAAGLQPAGCGGCQERGSVPGKQTSPCFTRTPSWSLRFTFRDESTYTGLGCESTMLDPPPACPRNKRRQNNGESCQARKRSCRYVICSPVAYWRGLRSRSRNMLTTCAGKP